MSRRSCGDSYSSEYYISLAEGARSSGRVVVPLVLELVAPRRVVDVGCGIGTWLSVFRELGVDDVWGIDGEHIPRDMLEIPEERFLPLDLERSAKIQDRFDLVVALEVAEHLRPEFAGEFVTFLTQLGPVVLFSAAIPGQGGEQHVNEQWPDYWVERFLTRDYVVIDWVRPKVWQDERVEWWYAQNALLFVSCEHLDKNLALQRARELTKDRPLALVHPKKYLQLLEWCVERAG
ncbi:MAG: class I SAM-dependent methyltransferase [Actinomycetota bacterium]|nr:class I SAM-dependent methyltransferase [Actinomycetota bacterium]